MVSRVNCISLLKYLFLLTCVVNTGIQRRQHLGLTVDDIVFLTLSSTVVTPETPPQPPAKLHPRLRTSIHPPLVLDKPDWPTWQPGITSSVFEAASEGYKGQPADSPFGHDIAPYDGMPNLRWLLLQVFKMLRQTEPGPRVSACQRELLLPFMEEHP